MKKVAIWLLVALGVFALVASADIYREAEYQPPQWEECKLVIERGATNDCWEITEDAPLFRAHYATLRYCEYHMSRAQHKELAREVARTIARFTNAKTTRIRFAHMEYPKPASSNIVDVAISLLGGKLVTDEEVKVNPQNER